MSLGHHTHEAGETPLVSATLSSIQGMGYGGRVESLDTRYRYTLGTH